ncbi:hypothetical protein CLOM_g18627 [Closterium sp. NIES-68]|nr:hypothetical protein CLOM_g18627 [Closterium sp. NIES-68]
MGIWSSRPEAAAEGEAAVAETKPKGLNLDDHVMLKRHLDEVATDIIISRGYEEDHTLSNVKMAICAAACAVACVAQFYPRKFPDNRALLLACILLYPPRHPPVPSHPTPASARGISPVVLVPLPPLLTRALACCSLASLASTCLSPSPLRPLPILSRATVTVTKARACGA